MDKKRHVLSEIQSQFLCVMWIFLPCTVLCSRSWVWWPGKIWLVTTWASMAWRRWPWLIRDLHVLSGFTGGKAAPSHRLGLKSQYINPELSFRLGTISDVTSWGNLMMRFSVWWSRLAHCHVSSLTYLRLSHHSVLKLRGWIVKYTFLYVYQKSTCVWFACHRIFYLLHSFQEYLLKSCRSRPKVHSTVA